MCKKFGLIYASSSVFTPWLKLQRSTTFDRLRFGWRRELYDCTEFISISVWHIKRVYLAHLMPEAPTGHQHSPLSPVTWMGGCHPQATATSQKAHDYYIGFVCSHAPLQRRPEWTHTHTHTHAHNLAGEIERHGRVLSEKQGSKQGMSTINLILLFSGQTSTKPQEVLDQDL